jgi:hypothetical protein
MSGTRAAASIAVVVTGLASAYTLALLLGMADPAWAYLARGIVHLGELAAVVALARCGAAGARPLATTGIGAAGLGAVLLAIAEVTTEGSPGASAALFAVAPILVGLGLVLAGIAVVRAGRWTGWRRWVVLALGIYVFAVLMPVIVASGGPPAVPSLAALLGWELLWLLIAASVLAETAGARRSTAPAAS